MEFSPRLEKILDEIADELSNKVDQFLELMEAYDTSSDPSGLLGPFWYSQQNRDGQSNRLPG